MAKVFLAEEERRRRNQAIAEVSEPDSPKNRLYILVAAVLILFAVGGFVYFRFFHTQKPVGDLRIDLPALVRSDETRLIDATGASVRSLGSQIGVALKAAVIEREIREIVLGQKLDGEVELSKYHRMSPNELLAGIGASPPESLSRSLTSEYFLGSYGGRNGPSPIILLTVDDHSVAYAGMLDWEPTLVRDLSGIFPLAWDYVSSEPKPTTEEAKFRFATTSKTTNTSTTTSTSTPTAVSPINTAPIVPQTPPPGSRNKFKDVVIANKDVRVLHGQNLQPLILYSFLDPNTILITDEPLLISEVFRRLSVDRQLH